MGRYKQQSSGYGKNRDEAFGEVCRDFYEEYGHSKQVEDVVREKLIEKIPPIKSGARYVKGPDGEYDWERDTSAPSDQWIERWAFEFVVHE